MTRNPRPAQAELEKLRENTVAYATANAVVSMNEQVSADDEWDLAPALYMIRRDITADYVLLAVNHIADLGDVSDDLAGALVRLAYGFAHHKGAERMLAEFVDGMEFHGFILLSEGWMVGDIAEEELEVQPSQHPDRREVRMVIAADRAGIYQVTEIRDGDVLLTVDIGRDNGNAELGGAVPNALRKLIDSIPLGQ